MLESISLNEISPEAQDAQNLNDESNSSQQGLLALTTPLITFNVWLLGIGAKISSIPLHLASSSWYVFSICQICNVFHKSCGHHILKIYVTIPYKGWPSCLLALHNNRHWVSNWFCHIAAEGTLCSIILHLMVTMV